jgi:hypothetical protein
VKIWKLLSVIAVDLLLLFLMPLALVRIGWVGPLLPRAWFVLGAAAVGLMLQTVMDDFISGESSYHRHGYDFCTITLGASLSSLAAQLITDQDLFPGLARTKFMTMVQSLRQTNRSGVPEKTDFVIVLASIFAMSCATSILTAYISKAVEDPATKFKNGLSIISFGIGLALFGWYILMLITGA